MNEQRLTYTLPETAELLGISERHLREQVRCGRIPVLRLGRRVLVFRETIEGLRQQVEAQQAAPRLRRVR